MPFKPAVGFILACIFLDALGIGLIVPVLPRLIGTLSETRDAQTWWYGLIMLSYGVMQFVSSPLLGALSDRIGRRPVLLGGILGLGLTFAVPAFSGSLVLILVSRVVGGMMSANMTVAQAYIADVTQGVGRCSGFGKIGAAFGVGFVLGPAVGGLLGDSDPRWPFMAASAVALLNFLYGAFVLPESLTERAANPLSWRNNNPLKALFDVTRVPANRLFLLILTLTSLANALMQCTWALYTEFRYGFTPLAIGLSVFALGLSIAFMQGVVLQRLIRFVAAAGDRFGGTCHRIGRHGIRRLVPLGHRSIRRLLHLCRHERGNTGTDGGNQPPYAQNGTREIHGRRKFLKFPHGSLGTGLRDASADVFRAAYGQRAHGEPLLRVRGAPFSRTRCRSCGVPHEHRLQYQKVPGRADGDDGNTLVASRSLKSSLSPNTNHPLKTPCAVSFLPLRFFSPAAPASTPSAPAPLNRRTPPPSPTSSLPEPAC